MDFFWLFLYSQPLPPPASARSISQPLSHFIAHSTGIIRPRVKFIFSILHSPVDDPLFVYFFALFSLSSSICLLFTLFFRSRIPDQERCKLTHHRDTDYRRRSKSCSLASLCIAFSSWRTALLIYSTRSHESDVWMDESHYGHSSRALATIFSYQAWLTLSLFVSVSALCSFHRGGYVLTFFYLDGPQQKGLIYLPFFSCFILFSRDNKRKNKKKQTKNED